MFEKNMNISFLLDFYGDVLDDKARDILDLYYNEDLSLAEIAESIGISRQGVRHSIKKSEEKLLLLEEKLGLANQFVEIGEENKRLADRLAGIIEMINGHDTVGAQKALAAEIEKIKSHRNF